MSDKKLSQLTNATSAGASDELYLITGGNSRAITRTALEQSLNAPQVFNVKAPEYGAVGDGSADDTTAIQSAISAAAGFGIIYFPPGSYLISSALTSMLDRIVFWGPGATIITASAINCIELDGSSGSEIDGAKIIGLRFNGPNDGTAARAIFADFADDLWIYGCEFRDFDGVGTRSVLLRDCLYFKVENCLFHRCTGGLEALQNDDTNRPPGSENSTVVGNNFHNLDEDGILLDETDSIVITGNSFKRVGSSTTHCIQAVTSVLSATISGNNFESGPGSAVYGPFTESGIAGNTGEAVGGSGIFNPFIMVSQGGNNIVGNTMTRVFGNGIELRGSNNNVEANYILGPGWEDASALRDGIFIENGKDNNSISGGYIKSSSGKFMRNAIRLDGGNIDNTSIQGVYMAAGGGTVTKMVEDLGAGTTIRNNTGWVTENSSTATINSGSTSVAVTHGLDVTPTIDDISVTLAENPTNDPGNIWVSGITSTQFTINCRNDPGASNLDLGWRVAAL